MNVFSHSKSLFLHPKKQLRVLCAFLAALFFALLLCACQKKTDYFNYVSELRSNILLDGNASFSLRVYATVKESPYSADGVPRECNERAEFWLVAPSGDKECSLSFDVNGKTYGGEMSYDSVKAEYYYAYPLDISAHTQLSCTVVYDGQIQEFNAKTVLSESTLSPENALKCLVAAQAELFTTMTDKYGFAGEIYLRLLYEDSPYYYIGVIDRNGKTNAFLLNATSGKLLAKRES
ncbi:MAG: hypothetical protein IJW60_06480 [Clostridia bacterium]|nr:hypothetical protein [Clostridia bacterium]